MKDILIQDFFENSYSNSALYNCYRSIGSAIDGLKPSSRKVVHTIRDMNITKEDKVSRLASKVSQRDEYIHGEGSLQGVIVNMAQNFVGSNNLSLLSPNGNFGSRHIPVPSASRYIFTKKSQIFDEIFNKEDDEILVEQEFEGKKIEPKFYIPIVPLILVNGSEGMGTGFAQKILPRNYKELVKAIKDINNKGKTNRKLIPYYEGFEGTITETENINSWNIHGKFEIVNTSNITITEIPIGYNLSSYVKVLNSLQNKDVIKSFEDLSEDDKFLFKLKVNRTFTNKPLRDRKNFKTRQKSN